MVMLAMPFAIAFALMTIYFATYHYKRNPGYGWLRAIGWCYISVIAVIILGLIYQFFTGGILREFGSDALEWYIIPMILFCIGFMWLIYKVVMFFYRNADEKKESEWTHCPACHEQVKPIKNKTNPWLHWLIAIFTSGFWIVVWYGLFFWNGKTWKCPNCQSIIETD